MLEMYRVFWGTSIISLRRGAVRSLARPQVQIRALAALEEHARVAALDLGDLIDSVRQALAAPYIKLHILLIINNNSILKTQGQKKWLIMMKVIC